MNVLQLGPSDWSVNYAIPKDVKWEYNAYPRLIKEEKPHHYTVVIITGATQLSDEDWAKLQWLSDPYTVLYVPEAKEQISLAGQTYLRLQLAKPINEEPQALINTLPSKYYFGQSGMRISPQSLMLNDRYVQEMQFHDEGHLILNVDTKEEWRSLGNYRPSLYVDPNRVIKFWLEHQNTDDLHLRLRAFYSPLGGDGDPAKSFILDMDTSDEQDLPLEPLEVGRLTNVQLEARGQGVLILGNLHLRWSRRGVGHYIVGGDRLVDPQTREEVGVYFNPGDLKPPLNVYFSGARELEGFEAYPLFRSVHAPSLLFTDPRLEVGQFYTGAKISELIKEKIMTHLKELGFTKDQLVMNGISMGTYPALKYGAELSAHAIIVSKPITNLGYVALRGRLHRPDEFDTIFDIDSQLTKKLSIADLNMIDQTFWEDFTECDLTNTKLFIAYMKDDDYDNLAYHDLSNNRAVKKARQFIYKGFPGRHNDDPEVVSWFVSRLKELMQNDFGRKG